LGHSPLVELNVSDDTISISASIATPGALKFMKYLASKSPSFLDLLEEIQSLFVSIRSKLELFPAYAADLNISIVASGREPVPRIFCWAYSESNAPT